MSGRVLAAFWNRRSSRLRLPWRLVALVVALVVVGPAVAFAVGPVLLAAGVTMPGPATGGGAILASAGAAVGVGIVSAATVGAVAVVGRYVDRRRLRDFGFRIDRDWLVNLGFGLALGAGLMTAVFLVELAAGWVTVSGAFRFGGSGGFWPRFGWAIAVFVAVGISEELLARGYLLTNLAEGLTWFDRLGTRGAVAVAVAASSLLFAVGHAANPNTSLASAAGIAVAGVMLAAGFVLTGELPIPIGIHVTWNLFQGAVFGFPVSGTTVGVSVLAIEQRGPRFLTGGAFGPEAGLLGVGASAAGVVLIALWVRYRNGRIRIDPSIVEPELRGHWRAPEDADG